jgi:coproporphyrinogen III oxidase
MSVMKGRVFEKVGVNVSTVFGEFSPGVPQADPGGRGGSALPGDRRQPGGAHAQPARAGRAHEHPLHRDQPRLVRRRRRPHADGPRRPHSKEDAATFHAAFRAACDRHDPGYYPRFKQWCDEYFFLPHRNEPRGLGGIFYDWLGDRTPGKGAEADFAFTKDVGLAFLEAYPAIIRRRMHEPWTEAERAHQLVRRGRYVEFNLLYDRGTIFGLKTGGNVEAILMSLPPETGWP